MKKTSIAISIIAALLLGATAQAALVISIEEVGNDVVATASGTLNIADLTNTGSGGSQPSGYLNPAGGWLIGGDDSFYYYSGATGASSLGTGGVKVGDSVTGDVFGLLVSQNYILISQTYVSGAQIDGTATWNNQTFATLGLDETSFTMTWGSGATADSMTVTAAVPEPATAGLLGISGLILFGIRRLKKTYGIR